MRSAPAALIATVVLLLAGTSVFAHHALQTQFDIGRTITLNGVVTKMDWSNPHVRLYLEVKQKSKRSTWELYLGSPNQQILSGWKIDTYRRGDHVIVNAYPARDGSNVGFARNVEAVSGQTF